MSQAVSVYLSSKQLFIYSLTVNYSGTQASIHHQTVKGKPMFYYLLFFLIKLAPSHFRPVVRSIIEIH